MHTTRSSWVLIVLALSVIGLALTTLLTGCGGGEGMDDCPLAANALDEGLGSGAFLRIVNGRQHPPLPIVRITAAPNTDGHDLIFVDMDVNLATGQGYSLPVTPGRYAVSVMWSDGAISLQEHGFMTVDCGESNENVFFPP